MKLEIQEMVICHDNGVRIFQALVTLCFMKLFDLMHPWPH